MLPKSGSGSILEGSGRVRGGFRRSPGCIFPCFVRTFRCNAFNNAVTRLLHVPALVLLPFRCGGLCSAHPPPPKGAGRARHKIFISKIENLQKPISNILPKKDMAYSFPIPFSLPRRSAHTAKPTPKNWLKPPLSIFFAFFCSSKRMPNFIIEKNPKI